jgi:hypothetical protein
MATSFPQIPSHVKNNSPQFRENSLKWKDIIAKFAGASAEAASESTSLSALEKHTASQLLGELSADSYA